MLKPITPISNAAFSPSRKIFFSTSALDFSTTSSILTGWIRPSWISFSKASFAISRRTGSKEDNTTASGVSSIIKSTPVNVSNVLIFRPSLPIILPFISSLGKETTETVDSTTCSIIQRCIVVDNISFAFSNASSFIFASFSLINCICSWAKLCFNCSKSIFFASSTESPEILSNSDNCFCKASSNSFSFLSISSSLLSRCDSLSVTDWILFSNSSSRLESLFSRLFNSRLRSLSSSLNFSLSFWRASLALIIASFLIRFSFSAKSAALSLDCLDSLLYIIASTASPSANTTIKAIEIPVFICLILFYCFLL